MKQTNVRLPDDTHLELKKLKSAENCSIAEIIERLYKSYKLEKIEKLKRSAKFKQSVNLDRELWEALTASAIEQRLTLTQYIGGLVDIHTGEVDELLQ